ncbi:hypothetical protein B9Z55_022088 [Caenorhabditis nigoni]|uniref:DNA-directed DNA polymerase n=1 Tax=Caenorhabditis nigoni TaxID=1611254 RepID=A0A2G5TUW1_9PELO|nr:hypothetical protein B9Z55_022088 [Caenorhabditis nigoni]
MGEGVGISVQPINRMKAMDIVETMGKMSQSNKSPLELENPQITAQITYIQPPVGSGKRKIDTGDIMELTAFTKTRKLEECSPCDDNILSDSTKSKTTRSNIMPNEVLEDCLIHALYQALMYQEWKESHSSKNRIKYRDSIRKTFKRPGECQDVYKAVQDIKERSGISKSSNFDRVDIEQLQKTVFAGRHQIIVFVKNSTIPYYKGPYIGEKRILVLYLSDGHYSGVRSVCALLKTNYYCALCNTRGTDATSHYNCPLRHRLCGAKECSVSDNDQPRKCETCKVTFPSTSCYENHKRAGPRGGKSRCNYTKTCEKCDTVYYLNKNKDTHKCGEKWCYRCNCKMTKQHKCIMPVSRKNEKKLTWKRVYYDIESRADEKTGQQIPVLFVALRCCSKCASKTPKEMQDIQNDICNNCAPDGRLKIIESITTKNRNVNVADELTKWIFNDQHRGRVVVAHNASGYDAQFILENLIGSNKAEPKLILDGTKILFLEHQGVRLLDSMKFLTMSLAAMGKAFEIDSVKGDFPVLFIRPEHFDYDDITPHERWYNLDNKTSKVKENLLQFLENEKKQMNKFNFLEEILKYCYNDVYILAKSMNIFETEFEGMTDVCLLEEATTAASAAALVFRRNHLDSAKPIVLDVKPSVSMNASVISQKYLAWVSKSEDVQIGKYRVDGFISPCGKYPEGLVIEFQGCYWHAHECSYSDESMIGDKSAKEIRIRDAERIAELKKKHPVRVVWECEVLKALKENDEMSEFFDNYEPVGILHCEKSLVGGRTEVFRLYANNIDKKLRYLDVVSLYPTVMKHESFPIGSPENVPRNEMKTPMTTPKHIGFKGFLSCRVLPPRKLLLPVLPMKYGGKLLFALCKKCSQEMNQSACYHTDEERAFNGTFTTVELSKALSLGYVITEIYHGVKYQHWVQNDKNGQGGLFTSYINQMMEEKIYSSGWPSDVKTDEEKEQFRKEYYEKEHIMLTDHLRFKKNPGKRAWGKFAQNVNRETTTIFIDPLKFWNLLYDTNVVISLVRCVNDVLIVKHRKQVETLESLRTSAMQLATLTTSYARLRLYRFMELVGGENIIYTDTDSIIYAIPDGTDDPLEDEVGSYLGQLTDELNGKMTEFVSLGPKTYCYKEELSPDEEKVVRKAKGVTMNSKVEKLVTFDKMKSMVDEVINKGPMTTIDLPQHTMFRDKDHRVYSRQTTKKFKFTFSKRRLLSDGSTLPFGYCD